MLVFCFPNYAKYIKNSLHIAPLAFAMPLAILFAMSLDMPIANLIANDITNGIAYDIDNGNGSMCIATQYGRTLILHCMHCTPKLVTK